MHTALRPLRQAAGLLLLAAVIVYTVSLVMVLVVSQQDERQPADAIVVLGAAQYNGRPSPVLRARLDHALGLYRERLAPLVVVTGG
ncbi:MAG TPA: ElyC/SanA/YdcF family protein, partial [Gemmatimonadales bacterium]|nr:ElyC/SanA/YdcF family protein [Gemmatimonadales bacterium]